ncbi:putative leucine-rich repeat domain superfamily [Helianthus anomalus]
MLTGEIPPYICNFLSLYILDLSLNNITRLIPQCLGKLSNCLIVLNLKNNTLQETIPNIFTNESWLETMDLSANKLEGKVPRSLEDCKLLEFLDLGYNFIPGGGGVMGPIFFSYCYVSGYMFGSNTRFGSDQTIITPNKTT